MKHVLITGGTGSFGQAFARRRLRSASCERVSILSRGEHAQAEMREALNDPRARFLVGDVRDRDRLRRAFRGCDVVVHAAALKRIEVGHYNPTEMVQTNIGGAINVIEAAMDAGVAKVVFLSSDKAWQPISPYGQSKALAETLFRNAYGGGSRFAVTRYGNVWASRGSVVPRWLEVLRTSDTVPVTDPDATRFFMRMDEAVDLVLDTIATMQGGELNIPTLPAYRLGDLAEAMGARMEVTGLPDWEKKHEGMSDGNTSDVARRMSVDELRAELEKLDGYSGSRRRASDTEGRMHRPGAHGQYEASRQGAVAAQWANGHRGSSIALPDYPWRGSGSVCDSGDGW